MMAVMASWRSGLLPPARKYGRISTLIAPSHRLILLIHWLRSRSIPVLANERCGFFLLLFPDNLDQDTFFSPPVKLAVKNLFPRAEVEFASGDGDHDFSSH